MPVGECVSRLVNKLYSVIRVDCAGYKPVVYASGQVNRSYGVFPSSQIFSTGFTSYLPLKATFLFRYLSTEVHALIRLCTFVNLNAVLFITGQIKSSRRLRERARVYYIRICDINNDI